MSRTRAFLREVPSMLPLSIVTAITTLVLLVILSLVLGGASREERASTRCYAAYAHEMLREIANDHPNISVNLNRFPRINLEGLDCSAMFEPLNDEPSIVTDDR